MPASPKSRSWPFLRSLFGSRKPHQRERPENAPARVSVVVPVYNKEKYLGDCLASLAAQTLADIEILCVDDGSTDGSRAILESFRCQDDRLRLIAHPGNLGTMAARRSGLREATGDFLASVDADDVADPTMLEKLHGAAVHAGADFVQCNGHLVDPDHTLPPTFATAFNRYLQKGADAEFSGPDIFSRYTSPIRVNLCMSLFGRRVYQAVIPFLDGKLPRRGDDNLLTFMFMYFSRKYVFVDEPLYGYRANETSSNLVGVSPELARSQIEGRAEALRFAKEFVQAVGLEWRSEDMPFSAFSHSILRYSKTFIDRCAAHEPTRRDALVRCFFAAFGEEATTFAHEYPEGLELQEASPKGTPEAAPP